jgi:hypothetical protein
VDTASGRAAEATPLLGPPLGRGDLRIHSDLNNALSGIALGQ